MTKCDILNEAQSWAEKIAKSNHSILKNLTTISKQASSLIKNLGLQKYLSLENVYSKVLREEETKAFKLIIDFVKSNKNKYSEDEILLLLGYLSRELTFYETSSQDEVDKKYIPKEKTSYKIEKNKGLTSNPFSGLKDMLNEKKKE